MHSALRYLTPVEFARAIESKRRGGTDGPDDQTARFLVHMSFARQTFRPVTGCHYRVVTDIALNVVNVPRFPRFLPQVPSQNMLYALFDPMRLRKPYCALL